MDKMNDLIKQKERPLELRIDDAFFITKNVDCLKRFEEEIKKGMEKKRADGLRGYSVYSDPLEYQVVIELDWGDNG